ncbi:hypothetical protein [Sphingobacterium sp. xlx-130]|uniref:hypothetical protein n=1 Tax=Sphingobacterium sp. xlx-130 TaxID=2654323 RepID=UPI0013D981E1|nr:hypothetical protein [Sphingobacterium sp. xlx-130]
MRKIKDPWIAKQKFKNINLIQGKLDFIKWVDFVELNNDYFTWYENTQDGIHLLENLDKVPVWAREGILNSSKRKALAEFNNKKGYYEVVISFNNELNVIGTTFQKKITKKHLYKLLEMANYLDAFLLNNGTEIIDEKVIESLT